MVNKSFRISERDWGKLAELAERRKRRPAEFVRMILEKVANGKASRAA